MRRPRRRRCPGPTRWSCAVPVFPTEVRIRKLAVVLDYPHRREGLDVVLGQVHRDALVDLIDRADRNGDLLAPPKVAFLEQHVGDVTLGRIDDEPFDLADLAVTGVHSLAPTNADLSGRELVAGLDHAGQGQVGVGLTLQAEVRPVVGLMCGVGVIPAAAGEEVETPLRRGAPGIRRAYSGVGRLPPPALPCREGRGAPGRCGARAQ